MMADANMPGSSPARCARRLAVDPCKAAGNGETPANAETLKTAKRLKTVQTVKRVKTLKTAKTVKQLKTAGALSHAPAAPTRETPNQDTPPASCNDGEAVKRAPVRPCGTTLRAVAETLKQRPKIQVSEDVTCFRPMSPASCRETVLRRNRATREALKHPALSRRAAARRARETLKRLKTAKRLKTLETAKTAGTLPNHHAT
jgi:hypothetical protein